MSFLSPDVPNAGNIKPERRDTGFSGPLPAGLGSHRLAFRHIEYPWNYRYYDNSSSRDGSDYYSIAGWICPGPVHSLRRIIVGGRKFDIFMDNPEDGSKYLDLELPYSIPKDQPVRLRFYWGYDDQLVEPVLNNTPLTTLMHVWERGDDLLPGTQTPAGTGRQYKNTVTFPPAPNIHPPYGGICWVMFYNFETGFPFDWAANGDAMGGGPGSAQATIPEIEFEIYRKPTILVGGEWAAGVNPVAVIYEYLTDPRFGLGLPASKVPYADWLAGAKAVKAFRWKGLNLMSPILSRSIPAASAIAELSSLYGGFLKHRSGKLLPGLMPETGDASFAVWLENSGFETAGTGGEPVAGWSKAGAVDPVRDTVVFRSGSASLRFDIDGTVQDTGISQELATIVPGKSYTVHISAKGDGLARGFKIGDGAGFTSAQFITATWAEYQIAFTPTDQTFRIHRADSCPANSKVWIDNVWITENYSTITANDIIGDPDLEPADSEETISEVTVRYPDMEELYEDAAVTVRNSVPHILRGEPKTETVDASPIRTESTAIVLGERVLNGKPATGRINVLREKARNPDGTLLMGGDIFAFDYGPWDLDIICRVFEAEDKRTEAIQIKFQVEQGTSALDYSPEPDTRTLPEDPAATDFAYLRAVMIPSDISSATPGKAIILGHRGGPGVINMEVWLTTEVTPASRWQGEETQVATQRRFAIRGTLNDAITDSATSFSIDLDGDDYDTALSEGFGTEAAADDEMLALVNDEWISLGALITNAGSSWDFNILRSRLGSTAAAHSLGDEVWLIRKSILADDGWSHNSFIAAPVTVYLKAVPRTIAEAGDPSAELSLAVPRWIPVPDGFGISVSGTQYREFTASWTPDSSVDWLLIYYFKTGDETATKKWVWAKVGDGSIVIPVDFIGGITAYAYRVKVINGVSYNSEVSGSDTDTINNYPNPNPVTGVTVSNARGHVKITWLDPASPPTWEPWEVVVAKDVWYIGGVEVFGPFGYNKGSIVVQPGDQAARDQELAGNTGWGYAVYVRGKVSGLTSSVVTATAAGGTGAHPLLPSGHTKTSDSLQGHLKSFTDTDVTVAENRFTKTAHKFVDGEPVVFKAATGGTLPAPLVEGTTYYIGYLDDDNFWVSTTPGGAAIDLTTAGSAHTHYIYARTIEVTFTETQDPFYLKTEFSYQNSAGATTYLYKQPTQTSFLITDAAVPYSTWGVAVIDSFGVYFYETWSVDSSRP